MRARERTGDKSSSGVFAIVIEFGSRREDLLFY